MVGYVVVNLLFYVPAIVCGGSVLGFVLYALLYVLSSFAIIFMRKREMVDLLLMFFGWMSCYCRCSVTLPYSVVSQSAVCDCGIS